MGMRYLAISGEDFSTYLHVLVWDKSCFVQWQFSKSVCCSLRLAPQWWIITLVIIIKLTFCLHRAQYSWSVFTALWCGCSVVKLTFYLHQTSSWLWLVWANSPVFTHQGMDELTSWHSGTNNSRTPLYLKYYCGNTHQVHEYPWLYHIQGIDCVKWQTITTLNRKLLQRV